MSNVLGESISIKDQYLHFKIGDISVSLRSELPEVLQDFAAIYRKYRVQPAEQHHTIRMEVRRAAGPLLRGRRFHLFSDGDARFGRIGDAGQGGDVAPPICCDVRAAQDLAVAVPLDEHPAMLATVEPPTSGDHRHRSQYTGFWSLKPFSGLESMIM